MRGTRAARRRLNVLVSTALVLAACSSGDPSGAGSTAPGTDPSTASSSAPTTTHGHETSTTSTEPPATSTTLELLAPLLAAADLPTDAPCALGAMPAGGEITFVVGGRLWGVGAGLTSTEVRCLADLGRDPRHITWSPDGDEVLVDGDLVVRADNSTSASGFAAGEPAVRWSKPTGKALVSTTAEGGVQRRNAHDANEITDVAFLATTTAVDYHPAGRHLVAAGTAKDGTTGIYVASNRGENMVQLGNVDSGTITDLAVAADGASVAFVHVHSDGMTEVHRYTFAIAALDTKNTYSDAVVTDLTVSTPESSDLAWRVDRAGEAVVEAFVPNGQIVNQIVLPAGVDPAPVGFVAGHRLVVSSRPAGDTGAPATLWTWGPDGTTRPLIDGVAAAAVRVPPVPYTELTIVQGSGFG